MDGTPLKHHLKYGYKLLLFRAFTIHGFKVKESIKPTRIQQSKTEVITFASTTQIWSVMKNVAKIDKINFQLIFEALLMIPYRVP